MLSGGMDGCCGKSPESVSRYHLDPITRLPDTMLVTMESMVSKTQNRLQIRAKSLNLDLAGEPEYVESAYGAIREVLMDRFRDSLDIVEEEAVGVAEAPKTSGPVAGAVPQIQQSGGRVNVVLCNDVYNKIFVIDQDDIESSMFGKVIDTTLIRRIYLNRSQQGRFEEFFQFGKVLWRELTSAGRAAVKKKAK